MQGKDSGEGLRFDEFLAVHLHIAADSIVLILEFGTPGRGHEDIKCVGPSPHKENHQRLVGPSTAGDPLAGRARCVGPQIGPADDLQLRDGSQELLDCSLLACLKQQGVV